MSVPSRSKRKAEGHMKSRIFRGLGGLATKKLWRNSRLTQRVASDERITAASPCRRLAGGRHPGGARGRGLAHHPPAPGLERDRDRSAAAAGGAAGGSAWDLGQFAGALLACG